jgi:GNAT superfamily N-acetyltransferase
MRALSEFEGYSDQFAVTQQALVEHGLCDTPRFGVFVALEGERIIGIAVHYAVPWTFDLRPTVVMKELFVANGSRSQGAGRKLFEAVEGHCQAIGAPRLIWQVLPGNERAKGFYRSLGGAPDESWEYWTKALPTGSPQHAQVSGQGG